MMLDRGITEAELVFGRSLNDLQGVPRGVPTFVDEQPTRLMGE